MGNNIFRGYLSDFEISDQESDNESIFSKDDTPHSRSRAPSPSPAPLSQSVIGPEAILNLHPVPPSKRRKLDVSACETKRIAKEEQKKQYSAAFDAIDKVLKSRKTEFWAGRNSLQERRARAIHGVLLMVVKRQMALIPVSKSSATTHGFAPNHGSRMLRGWVKSWILTRELPTSSRGSHAKVFSLLSDPTLHAEIQSYLRSNKWAMNPGKFQAFVNKTMLPDAAKAYAKQITATEMPEGLKKYFELELFPRIGLKVKTGICKTTARAIIREEGFANDGLKWSWVFKGEHAIRKKGVGRGIHQSDVICSTFGWLKDASQSMEYGKNYDGYWNGELFIKQVIFRQNGLLLKEKIIPTFEKLHGPNYQALFLIDNSQGHSAYAVDALLANRMNFNPGGKQARMCRGWFLWNGQCIHQDMFFPCNHPEFPNQPKGMKVLNFIEYFWGAVKKYLRDHCDYTFDTLKANIPSAMSAVMIETIRRWEHRVHRWISGYHEGLSVQDAQAKVKAYSSKMYTSH
ncbi:hypothetical protein C8J55DRAFT_418198 [Lentinula edodes]|uniref:DDE-1 domain-containing protein n=1 Tax=Lentinula lateritia TaxID=40482 RepID=A0A9W9AZD3_9AGAR|nr:hypothetical protein C8J55DRAFT_418198 [Lentinula edodes]